MPPWSWSLVGTLLFMALGLVNTALAVTGERQDHWWVTACSGLSLVLLGVCWLRALRARAAAEDRR